MDEPQKLVALKALCTWLEGIVHVEADLPDTPGVDWDGFDLDGKVFRGRAVFGQEDKVPMLSVLEDPRPEPTEYAGMNNQARHDGWRLLVQGWVEDDKKNPTDPAYRLANVVEKRLAQLIAVGEGGMPVDPDNYMLGIEGVTNIAFGPYVVRPPTEGISAKAFFYMPVKVGLASVVG